jgi:hypothetical protein
MTEMNNATVLTSVQRNVVSKRSLVDSLAPLETLAADSPNLIANHGAHFELAGCTCVLPRYLFIGPKGGGDPIRIGLFAGIHGDEPEGVHGLIRFVGFLEEHPHVAAGFCLFIYPVCNPTGFEAGTRNSRAGKDLNREFWRGSQQPEVRLLESELVAHSLHGIVSLHSHDSSQGFYGFARGATLTRHLIEPALQAAAEFLPRNRADVIDGFPARNGIIRNGYDGMLSAAPRLRPRPFEIILETPAEAPTFLKEAAFVASLTSILTTYREFIAYAPNL